MQNRTLLGIICLCVGVLVFSLQDALIKAVSGRYPVTEALTIRALIAVPLIMIAVHIEAGLGTLISRRAAFLMLRALILFFSYTAYYLAIAALPMADAVALFFTAPLFILLIAGPYLGEHPSARTLFATLTGLAGVLVMLRPGAALFDWAALLSLGSAAAYGFAQLMARRAGDTTSAAVMAFYQNGVFLVLAVLVAASFALLGIENAAHPSLDFLVRPWGWPTLPDFLTMAACGFVATAGTILLTQAYRMAAANTVATFEYTGILWTPLWGFLFFGEVPQVMTAIGAALIVGAGLLALAQPRAAALVEADPAEATRRL